MSSNTSYLSDLGAFHLGLPDMTSLTPMTGLGKIIRNFGPALIQDESRRFELTSVMQYLKEK